MCSEVTVFLIDDDAAVRDALSISLSMAGIKIEIFYSGKAFLKSYAGEQGCLLMNHKLAEMEGSTIQHALAERNFSIPIVFMADTRSILRSIRSIPSGASIFLLETPFTRQALLERVGEAFERDCIERSRLSNSSSKAEQKFSADCGHWSRENFAVDHGGAYR